MKKYIIAAAIIVTGLAASGQAQAASAGGISASADVGVYNQYIWRGAPQNTNKAATQGDFSLSMPVGPGDLSASVWASNTFASPAPQFAGQDAIEFDWTLDYSASVGDLGVSIGSIYYTYLRDSTANFVEIYGGLSYDALISPSISIYYTVADSSKAANNLNETGDIWVDVGLSSSLSGIDLSGTVSFARYDSDTTRTTDKVAGKFKNGASVVTLSMSKDFTVGDVTLTPSLTAYIPVVSKAPADGKRYIYNTISDNNIVFGINAAF
ncbi:MAG: TorF family putative porin [Mariprofundaceae bacterium]